MSIDKLKAAYEAATPGEWKPLRSYEDSDGPYFEIDPDEVVEYEARPYTRIESDHNTVTAAHDLFTFKTADAEFIALAHNMMPKLLNAARVLEIMTDVFNTTKPDPLIAFTTIEQARHALKELI